jgi:vanillate O-demethylase ferredoxin subunit
MTQKSRQLRVAGITPIARDVLRLRLAAEDGQRLPAFTAGAHIEIAFDRFRRSYSLTSSPKDRAAYEICVLGTPRSRGGSQYIHEQLRVGDPITLDAGSPVNAFALNTDAAHSVFIAGGIGITPFITMIEELGAIGKHFELHYAARSRDRFLPIAAPSNELTHYVDKDAGPRLDVDRLLDQIAPASDLYVCGPRSLIDTVRTKAASRGWPPQSIHYESFGAQRRAGDKPIEVRLAMSGRTIVVDPNSTILEALLEAGIWAPYECRRGECGACVSEVISGEIDHRDVCLDDTQRAHFMCTCVSWARNSPITLNL